MTEIQKKIEIATYYAFCLNDLESGITLDEMNITLSGFKEDENYLACEGLTRAIKDYNLIQEQNG